MRHLSLQHLIERLLGEHLEQVLVLSQQGF